MRYKLKDEGDEDGNNKTSERLSSKLRFWIWLYDGAKNLLFKALEAVERCRSAGRKQSQCGRNEASGPLCKPERLV